MANRSYLYSLSNRPTSYDDRPETIAGLSEWAYDVPFIYRLLMSADPQLCASLVADGLDHDEESDKETRLYAISSPFAPGLERVTRFAEILKILAVSAPPVQPAPPEPPASIVGRFKQIFSNAPSRAATPAPASADSSAAMAYFPAWLDEAVAFLEAHRDEFLLLETIELDTMTEGEEDGLRQCVEAEIETCRQVGAAFDALPADLHEAAQLLRLAAAEEAAPPLDAFFGLRFDDDCDSTRTGATDKPLGLTNWSEVLYFGLFNRAEFEAHEAKN
ncbi:DUF7822 domain-containing protein [Variovorax ginsengisoli]|uniref:DUF7822 domain-containing protein n=1 Tax=Variovorax ginsengisoli TaxID=363844 RepID=A0ABT9S361_9BURK|nr:hypothetical protein [Variovorax ginsengisoli]MDP9898779.1 hypothetical protein [Variovorax ginsengisoli]